MRFANGLTTILVLFLVTMGFRSSAIAATFNVTDVAGLRAALVTAATNGQDDVIVLAAGTYATGGTTFTFLTNESNSLTLQGASGTTRSQVILDGGGTSLWRTGLLPVLPVISSFLQVTGEKQA